jgi:hypothetical protein
MIQATHSVDLLVLVQALVVFAYRDLWTGVTERGLTASRTQRRVNEGRTMKMSALTSEKQLCGAGSRSVFAPETAIGRARATHWIHFLRSERWPPTSKMRKLPMQAKESAV